MLKGFLEDFKAFAVKGNAIDMAVGIVVGAAFNKVVNSIVTDLLMPPLGLAIGGVDFKELKWTLQPAKAATDAAPALTEVSVRYGMFFNSIIEFVIVAFSAFVAVRVMGKVMAMRGADLAGLVK
ncbi:MAG: large conductance mechanosensitive channel protein MscL [Phycisphaerales bacterium]|nr:large conductance mechanosensitive channel protein MscL [Phycisphaerales bacterium]